MRTPPPSPSINAGALDSIRALFRYYYQLGTRAMAQVETSEIHHETGHEANSIAVIVGHLSGNMLSRWTDFLESDGEKTWRNREAEFAENNADKETVLEQWDRGWKCLFDAIDPLVGEDLERIVYIRNEGHTVIEALHRQLTHYSYHVGQIVLIAKSIRGAEWQSLSIPRGGSKAFNAEKFDQEKSRRHFLKE